MEPEVKRNSDPFTALCHRPCQVHVNLAPKPCSERNILLYHIRAFHEPQHNSSAILQSDTQHSNNWSQETNSLWTSLVAQWLRICLPMQGTRVWALVREDPTCREATKPVCHNRWACALEPTSHNYWACMPQLLTPTCLEPVLHNKRSHRSEQPAHHNKE